MSNKMKFYLIKIQPRKFKRKKVILISYIKQIQILPNYIKAIIITAHIYNPNKKINYNKKYRI